MLGFTATYKIMQLVVKYNYFTAIYIKSEVLLEALIIKLYKKFFKINKQTFILKNYKQNSNVYT